VVPIAEGLAPSVECALGRTAPGGADAAGAEAAEAPAERRRLPWRLAARRGSSPIVAGPPAAPGGAQATGMHDEPYASLRRIGQRAIGVLPELAPRLANLPEAGALTLRDLAALFLLAPGEHVARPAIELLVGTDAADTVISNLAGHGLLVEERGGVVISERGRAFVDGLVDARARVVAHVLRTLPAPTQAQVLQSLQLLADAMPRADALVKV
jgi:hypothetical protein